MATKIPESFLDILDKKTFVHLATLGKGGAPQVSPVWVDREGDLIVVNSAKGRVKDRNIRSESTVALSATDPDNPYRALMIQGKVVKITEEGADAHIDKMAKKYLGQDKYPFRTPTEVRVKYYIEPTHVATMG
jgi:PPOX class probable F420-dependent enzyme